VRDLDRHEPRIGEPPIPHLRRLDSVLFTRPTSWRHVVDQEKAAGPERGDRGVEPFPLAAFTVGEDQIERARLRDQRERVALDDRDEAWPHAPSGARDAGRVELDRDDLHVVLGLEAVHDPRQSHTTTGAELEDPTAGRYGGGQYREEPTDLGVARQLEAGLSRDGSRALDSIRKHERESAADGAKSPVDDTGPLVGSIAMSARLDPTWKVLASPSTPAVDRCVDIFSRPDGTFGFEEFRRDPEDMGAWTPVAYYSEREFLSEADALAAARERVPWLAGVLDH
jgi:hypothetical protein